MLAKYQTRTQTLISDPQAQFWSLASLTNYINEARGQIASEGECIKVLPPSSNAVASIAVTAGGSGYTGTPTVVITGNGTGATATATVVGNAVTSVAVTAGGTGYDKTTTISFTGGGGTGATATATVNAWNTVNAQEVYTFAAANAFARLTSGVDSILFVESIAVSWGALRPVLDQWNWNDLQAKVRAFPITSGQPAIWSQFGQGQGGSVYLRPVPTGILQMDWNCVCTPIDLVDDTTPEALPYPWTDCVPYYAAWLAFMNARRPGEAQNMRNMFEQYMKRARSFSEPSYIPSYYA